MSRFNSYINTAARLIENYQGEIPFAIFIKNFFAADKKYGSKDRKQIAALCYNYFRIGFASAKETIERKIIIGNFLCETSPSDLMEKIAPEWNKIIDHPFEQKLIFLQDIFTLTDIFPFQEELSKDINAESFCRSYLIQPDLFLRIRPKTMVGCIKKLEKSKLEYTIVDEDCLTLSNATKVEEYFIPDKEVVIQDYNSQKVFDYFKPQKANYLTPLTAIWDCCAASGGKSILLYDIFNQRIDLTVSDIRPSIILNLHQRFKKAGLKEYNYFIADIEKEGFEHPINEPEIIVCDAPCTGSGTWGRTPDQLRFFDPATIDKFSDLQKKIAANVIAHLKKGGTFVYITCSVFKKENEDVVNFLMQKLNLELLDMQILKGYDKKADSMFTAVLRKN